MSKDFDVIYSYSRKQALEDGILIDVSGMAKEAGIKYPVAITTELFHKYIAPTPEEQNQGQDLDGRLWDTLYMFTLAARKAEGSMLLYPVIYATEQDSGEVRQETIKVKAIIGPGDTPEPVITLMLPYED